MVTNSDGYGNRKGAKEMEEKKTAQKKPLETPKAEVVKLDDVHNAKSWNPGKGNDKTGTGNSGNNKKKH